MLMLLQIGMGLNFMSPTPLFTVIMSEYDIGRSSVSLLVAATIIVITVTLLPGGVLISKIGSKKAMAIAGFLMSAHLLTPLTDSFTLLVMLRLVFGMGVAISIPATSAITMEWFKPNELPLMNGINEAGRALGVSAGVLIAVPITNIIGWEMTLFSFGIIPLIGTFIWMIGGRSNNSSANIEPALSLRQNIPLMLNRNTLLLATGMAGAFAVFIGFSSWLPAYYNEAQGMTLQQAGSLVAIMPLTSAVLNPVSGLVQSKLARRKPMLIMSGLMMPLFALGSFLLTDPTIITICVMGLGAMFSIFIVASLTIPMELPGVSASQVGIVTAAILTIGNLAGVMSPIFVGSLTDFMGSYIPALSILALAPLTLVIAGVFLPETGSRGRQTPN
jgi:nitrate/nitrite transporter NarK